MVFDYREVKAILYEKKPVKSHCYIGKKNR